MTHRIIYRRPEVVTEAELNSIFSDIPELSDIDVVVLGYGLKEGKMDLLSVLMSPEIKIYAVFATRKAVSLSGTMNKNFSDGQEYEYLTRAIKENETVYFLPCEEELINRDYSEYSRVLAFVVMKNMLWLKERGALETVFEEYMSFVKNTGVERRYTEILNMFMSDVSQIDDIDKNTKPILLISGDDTCYNVLRTFSDSLADALVDEGRAVVTTNGRYGNVTLDDVPNNSYFGAAIGFQAPGLFKDFIKNFDCKKIQFWFDNPLFSPSKFEGLDDNYYFLSQDKDYAFYLSEYFGIKNSLQLSPGGEDKNWIKNTDRPYDVTFVGSYYSHEESKLSSPQEEEFFSYMLSNPEKTFEQGIIDFVNQNTDELLKGGDYQVVDILNELYMSCKKTRDYYRGLVMSKILSAGIKVHVFGDSWESFNLPGKENLVIHEEMPAEKTFEFFGKSKIGLNIMSWHKAGMTERVANIMLSGAVCVSDETSYLVEHFENGNNMVLFSLENLDEIPDKIRALLSDEKSRSDIAGRAYKTAIVGDTWKAKAKRVLEIIDG